MPRIASEMTRRARVTEQRDTSRTTDLATDLRFRPRFTRQLVVGNFIIDLACREAKLAIEFDDSQHVDSEYDADRIAFLESLGWRVVRFWNSDVIENPDGVTEAILASVGDPCGPTHPQPSVGSAMPPAWPEQRGALFTRHSFREGRRTR